VGLQPLAVLDIGTRARQSCVGAHFKVVPYFVGRRCGTNFSVLVTVESKERHPRLQPSDRWRLTFDELAAFLVHSLNEGVLILPTWVIIASWPTWPFHFFTDVFPADVTGAESGLVRYSFLKFGFQRAYN
jgi:hypothetical protein